jgi:hypothetical protein
MRAEMFDFAIFIIFALLFMMFGVFNLRLRYKNLELLFKLNHAIATAELTQKSFNKNVSIEQEHLLAFLNETRDIAYKYIEDVHKALLEYQKEIEFDLENPNDLSIIRFRSAFEKLKQIFPEDIPND